MNVKYCVLIHFALLANVVNSDSKSVKNQIAGLEEVAKWLYPLKMPENDPGPNAFRNLEGTNAWEEGDDFEGDIVLEKPDETRAGSFRLRWPRGYIPFNWVNTQWDDLSHDQRWAFLYALTDFSDKTCIRFNYCGENCSTSSNVLGKWVGIITRFGDTRCASRVGMQERLGQQDLYLAANCFDKKIIIHELIHVVGFWHEQSRGDRDIYVAIHEENIEPQELHNFEKYNRTDSVTGYDPYSVMHYSRGTFSKNGGDTITYKHDSSYNNWFGYGDGYGGMSKRDEVAINIRYDCCLYGHDCTIS